MTAQRRPYIAVAATEAGFAAAAFACGIYDAPIWLAGLVAFGMLAYWSWTRRRILDRLRGAAWARQSAMAVLVLIAIQAGSYWLGLNVKGVIG